MRTLECFQVVLVELERAHEQPGRSARVAFHGRDHSRLGLNGCAVRVLLRQGLQLALGSADVTPCDEATNERQPGVGVSGRVLEGLFGELHRSIDASARKFEPGQLQLG